MSSVTTVWPTPTSVVARCTCTSVITPRASVAALRASTTASSSAIVKPHSSVHSHHSSASESLTSSSSEPLASSSSSLTSSSSEPLAASSSEPLTSSSSSSLASSSSELLTSSSSSSLASSSSEPLTASPSSSLASSSEPLTSSPSSSLASSSEPLTSSPSSSLASSSEPLTSSSSSSLASSSSSEPLTSSSSEPLASSSSEPLIPSSSEPLAASSFSSSPPTTTATSSSSPISRPPPSSQGTLSSSPYSSVSTVSTTKEGPTPTEPTPVYTSPSGSTDASVYYTPANYPIESFTSSGYRRVFELTTVTAESKSTWTTSSLITDNGGSHTTVFPITTVFEPGAVITIGELLPFSPKGSNIRPIIGGVVGGMVGLMAMIIFLIYWYVLRQRSHKGNSALFDPGRLSGINRVVSGNPPHANFVIDEENGMGDRLANTVSDSGIITPFIYDPLSIEMGSMNQASIIAATGEQANAATSNSHRTIATSPPGSPVSPTFSDAASFYSKGGSTGYSYSYQVGPSPGSFRNESNRISSGSSEAVYYPRSPNGVGLMHLRGAPIISPNEVDVDSSRASSSYPTNIGGGAGMGYGHPGYLQGCDADSSFAGSTVLPSALRPCPRFGSAMIVHNGGGSMEMRINFQGVPEEEEPATIESPPLYATVTRGES